MNSKCSLTVPEQRSLRITRWFCDQMLSFVISHRVRVSSVCDNPAWSNKIFYSGVKRDRYGVRLSSHNGWIFRQEVTDEGSRCLPGTPGGRDQYLGTRLELCWRRWANISSRSGTTWGTATLMSRTNTCTRLRRPNGWRRTNWSTLSCRRVFCRRQT